MFDQVYFPYGARVADQPETGTPLAGGTIDPSPWHPTACASAPPPHLPIPTLIIPQSRRRLDLVYSVGDVEKGTPRLPGPAQ